jgi:hypothetical protein
MSVRAWLAFDRLRRGGLSEAEAAQAVFQKGSRAVIEALTLRREGKPYTKPTARKGAANKGGFTLT